MKVLTSGFEDHVAPVEPGIKESLEEAILNHRVDKPLSELPPDRKISLRTEYYMQTLSEIISHQISG